MDGMITLTLVTYASERFRPFDMQCCTNARRDPNMHKPYFDGDGAAHGYGDVGRVMEWLELDEYVHCRVKPLQIH